MIILAISLFLINAWILFQAFQKSKKNGFYTDTFYLYPLGIFIWGDALILSPFWCIAALIFLFLNPVEIIRLLLIFYIFRSSYEVIYWLVHQSSQKNFHPPLFKKLSWLGVNESAILYQLLHFTWIVLLIFALSLTFKS